MNDICLIAIKVRRSNGTFYTLPTIKGGPGDNGKSAYQVALDNGFVGTEAEWLESLKQGPAGAAGNSLQFIYYRTTDAATLETPISVNVDNSVPESWTAVPIGVTEMYKYEWVSLRTRVNEVWGVYSTPALWAIYGFGSTLPEILIEDVAGLTEVLTELTDNQQYFIPKSYLFNPLHTKVASLNELNLLNPSMFPIATSTALGAIKVGPTLKINAGTGVLDTDISFEDLTDSALSEGKVDGAAVVWNETLGKYINTNLSITGLFHPLYGKDTLNLRADILRSKTLIIPKTPATPDANEVALHAVENGYSIADPEAPGVQQLSDLSDILFTNQLEGDSLFKVGDNYVNLPAMNKTEIYQLFGGMASSYHPLGGSYLLDFKAKDLKSVNLFIPTTPYTPIPEGVTMRAQENGYSIFVPDTFVTEFAQLEDILALTWSNGQGLIYRNGDFTNEFLYNKEEIDTLLDNLNLSDYYDKTYIEAHFHPKYGLTEFGPLDLTADRLKSNVLLIPKTRLLPNADEVAIAAIENGYSIMDPSTIQTIESIWDIPGTSKTGVSEANKEVLFFNGLDWTNKQLIPTDILGLPELFEETAPAAHNHDDLYYTKLQAGEAFHPKYGLFNHNFKANRLEAKTFIIPNAAPLMDTYSAGEVTLHAQENGYSIMDPGSVGAGELTDLSDVDVFEPTLHQTLIYSETLGVFVNDILTFDMIPGSLAPTRIALSAAYRFVTDEQITSWNSREFTSNRNIAGGYLGLNLSRKIDFEFLPDIILGQVKYGGTFNINGIITSPFTDLNGIDINTLTESAYTGYYFISQATTTVVSIDVLTGDWVISNGAAGWAKVDNTDAVTSVNGRIGPIILTKSDVDLSNVDNTADSLKNVLSATKLFTARTLWGQSFDGTYNITGSLIDVTHITGSGIVNMGAILIPKTLYPTIPNNTVAIHAVENGYSIYDPEAGSVGSLDDLSDVDLIARVDKQLFYYSSTLGKFTNGIIDFSYISGNLGADKITQSDSYRFVTATEKSRFQTAYDWGNHALAGYALNSALNTHAGLTTTAHGLGASAFHTDNYYALLARSASQDFFTNNLTVNRADSDTVYMGSSLWLGQTYIGLRAGTDKSFNIDTYNSGSGTNALKILQTGAAIFSSSITALSGLFDAGLNASSNEVRIAGGWAAGNTVTLWVGNNNSTYKNYSPYFKATVVGGIDNYSLKIGLNNSDALTFSTTLTASFASTVSATGFTENGTALASKYLSLLGGTITGSSFPNPLSINTTNVAQNYITFKLSGANKAYIGYGVNEGVFIQSGVSPYGTIGILDDTTPYYSPDGGTNKRTLWHTGNLTNTLSNGYLPYWNGSSLGNSFLYVGSSQLLEARKDQNAQSQLVVRNDTSGSGAASVLGVRNGDWTKYGTLYQFNSGYTTNGLIVENSVALLSAGNTNGLRLFTYDATNLTLGTNNTERVRILSNGNVYIGTTWDFNSNGEFYWGNSGILTWDTNFASVQAKSNRYLLIGANGHTDAIRVGTDGKVSMNYGSDQTAQFAVNGSGYFADGLWGSNTFTSTVSMAAPYFDFLNTYSRIATAETNWLYLINYSAGAAVNLKVGGLLVSGSYSQYNLVPANGIYAAGAIISGSHLEAPTAKLTNLSDGQIPFHMSDSVGLANSAMTSDGTNIAIWGAGVYGRFNVLGGDQMYNTVFQSVGTSGGVAALAIYMSSTEHRIHTEWWTGSYNVPLVLGTYTYRERQLKLFANGRVQVNLAADQGYAFSVGGTIYTDTSVKIGANWEAILNGTSLNLTYNTSPNVVIDSSGNITAPGFYHSSDITLKNVIELLDPVMDKIRGISTFYYTYKKDITNKVHLGFSAQQFLPRFNGLVDRDSEGFLQLEYTKITVIAIKAIQELDKIQQTQEQEIRTLKDKVKQLEERLNGTNY